MKKLGYNCCYDVLGPKRWTKEVQWGYQSSHAYFMRFELNKNEIYQELYNLVKEKEHFVITSNVDGKFEQNGFEKKNIYTPQGDYSIIQCQKKCSDESFFYAEELMKEMSDNTDKETQVLKKMELVPKCSKCGGDTCFVRFVWDLF
jgi:NAD-dependent SIR2 family protein deacetylase